MRNKLFTTKNISGMAVFSALSFILYLPFFEIPLFPGTPYKLDFSNVFVLLGGYMYGPIGAVIILLVKELIHIPVGSTGGVGELANIIVGFCFVVFPTVVYRYKKGFKTVISTLSVACLIQIAVGLLANRFILLPFFNCTEMFSEWFWIIVILNSVKSLSVSLFSVFFYKKLSFLFKKINLQEDYSKGTPKGASNTPESVLKEYESESEEQTRKIAFDYAKTLKRGDVVLLNGDLGAGKTAFVKGVAEFFGLTGVTSPTYAYLNVYGDFIYHYDCYRLASGEDAVMLGLNDYFNGDNVCLIEWAENIKDILPEKVKTVTIEKTGENRRRILL